MSMELYMERSDSGRTDVDRATTLAHRDPENVEAIVDGFEYEMAKQSAMFLQKLVETDLDNLTTIADDLIELGTDLSGSREHHPEADTCMARVSLPWDYKALGDKLKRRDTLDDGEAQAYYDCIYECVKAHIIVAGAGGTVTTQYVIGDL